MKAVSKIASDGKVLGKVYGDKLIITTRVQAPEGTDLSEWLEFNNREEAIEHYGIKEENVWQ